jgi:hypothetical protein
MGFSNRSTSDLVQIVANGGGLILDAGARPEVDLVQIAANAAGKCTVTMLGMEFRTTAELARIAANGKGSVVFG